MQSDATAPEYEDLESHRKMWAAFTGLIAKSLASIVILLLFLGWITDIF